MTTNNRKPLTRIGIRYRGFSWEIRMRMYHHPVSGASIRRFMRLFGMQYMPVGDLVFRHGVWMEEYRQIIYRRLS
jgi:hypothetical protein